MHACVPHARAHQSLTLPPRAREFYSLCRTCSEVTKNLGRFAPKLSPSSHASGQNLPWRGLGLVRGEERLFARTPRNSFGRTCTAPPSSMAVVLPRPKKLEGLPAHMHVAHHQHFTGSIGGRQMGAPCSLTPPPTLTLLVSAVSLT